jgi:integrase
MAVGWLSIGTLGARYVYRKSRGEAKKALREALADRDEGVFYLCPLVELRIGEALRYEDLDLERGTIRVERTLHEGECSASKASCSRRTYRCHRGHWKPL